MLIDNISFQPSDSVLILVSEELQNEGSKWTEVQQSEESKVKLVVAGEHSEVDFPENSLDVIFAASKSGDWVNKYLPNLLSALKPSGSFTAQEQITARKPEDNLFTTTKVEIAKPQKTSAQTWKVTADEGEDEDDFIDEDALLDNDVVEAAAPVECGTGAKKRACKDCTCGLREKEDAGAEINLSEKVSSCGNCFKGDAFRCGSCPFLGKPAFKPGMEKVMLDMSDDI